MGIEVNGQPSALAIDLTSGAEVDCVIENTGATTETGISLDNSMAGVTVSENGTLGPFTQTIAPFDLNAAQTGTVTNTDTTYDTDHAVFNGTSSALEQNNWDEIGGTGNPIATIYVRFKVITNPSSSTPIVEIPDSRAAGSPSIGIYLTSSGKLWMQYRTLSTVRAFELSSTYSDSNYHEALVKCNGSGFGRYETDLEGLDQSGVSGDFVVDNALGIQIGALQSLSRYNNIHITEVKIWNTAQTIATKSSTTGLVFDLAWSGTEFYNTIDGVPSPAGTKTLTFKHDPKYVATTSVATTFDISGSNTVTVTPTKDTFEAPDLINNVSDYIFAQNTTGAGINITSNAISGLEWSPDGINFFTGADSFAVAANDATQRWYRYDTDNRVITLPYALTLTDDSLNSTTFQPEYKPLADLGNAPEGGCSVTTKYSIVNNDSISRDLDVSVSGEFEIKLETESTWLTVIPTFAIPVGETRVVDFRSCPTSIGVKAGIGTVEYNPTLLIGLTALGVGGSKVHSRSVQRRLPTGRAWNGPVMTASFDGVGYEFNTAEENATDIASIENILFNDKLTAWQNVLGLTPVGTLTEQNNDVVRKLRDTGGLRAQDIEDSLQAAGFSVYVHTNHFAGTADQFLMGGSAQMGGAAYMTAPKIYGVDPRPYLNSYSDFMMGRSASFMGSAYMQATRQSDIVVNSILASDDEQYRSVIAAANSQIEWQYILFIGGQTFGTSADVDTDRESEFRRLILELKPLGMMVILLVNYL
jgi:hypothetical protein